MRFFVMSFVALWLASGHASAQVAAPCMQAVKSNSISAIESDCGYLQNSSNRQLKAMYHRLLGSLYGGKVKFKAGAGDRSYEPAIWHLSQALALEPNAEDYYLRGITYLQNMQPGGVFSRDADKALADFNRAISLQPRNAQYHLSRGYAHNQLLKAESAWEDFKRAYALDPSNPDIQDAYQKQWKYSPEGKAEVRRRLDSVLGNQK